ncbi:MAG TPA: hypothetical protein VJ724_13495 [Tahibacter sp.]|nr:hypothetical protein [Tahibacter sp.]
MLAGLHRPIEAQGAIVPATDFGAPHFAQTRRIQVTIQVRMMNMSALASIVRYLSLISAFAFFTGTEYFKGSVLSMETRGGRFFFHWRNVVTEVSASTVAISRAQVAVTVALVVLAIALSRRYKPSADQEKRFLAVFGGLLVTSAAVMFLV